MGVPVNLERGIVMAKKSEEYKEISEKLEEEIKEYEDELNDFTNICGDLSDLDTPEFANDDDKKNKYQQFTSWCQKNGFLSRFGVLDKESLPGVKSKIEERINFLKKQKGQNDELSQKYEYSENLENQTGVERSLKNQAKKALNEKKKEIKKENSKSTSDSFWKNCIWNKIRNGYANIRNVNLKVREFGFGIPSFIGKSALSIACGALLGPIVLGPLGISSYAALVISELAFYAIPFGTTVINFVKDRIKGVPDDMKKKDTMTFKEFAYRLRKTNNIGKESSNTQTRTNQNTNTRSRSNNNSSTAVNNNVNTNNVNNNQNINSVSTPVKIESYEDAVQLCQRLKDGQNKYSDMLILEKAIRKVSDKVTNEIGFKRNLTEEEQNVINTLDELRAFKYKKVAFEQNIEHEFNSKFATASSDEIRTFEQYRVVQSDLEALYNAGNSTDFQIEMRKVNELKAKSNNKYRAFLCMDEYKKSLDINKKANASKAILKLYKEQFSSINNLYKSGCGYNELEKAIFEFWETYKDISAFMMPGGSTLDPEAIRKYLMHILEDTKSKEQSQSQQNTR